MIFTRAPHSTRTGAPSTTPLRQRTPAPSNLLPGGWAAVGAAGVGSATSVIAPAVSAKVSAGAFLTKKLD